MSSRKNMRPEVVVPLKKRPKASEVPAPRLIRPRREASVDNSRDSSNEHGQNMEDEISMVDSESGSEFEVTAARPRKIRKVDAPKKATKKPAKTPKLPVTKDRKRVNYSEEMLHKMQDERDLDLEKAKSELDKTKKQLKELKAGKLANSRIQVGKKNIKLGELRDDKAAKNKQIKELNEKVKVLKQTLRSQNSSILKFQKKLLPELDQKDFIVESDDIVSLRISKLFRSTKTFSRNYSQFKWADLDLQAQQTSLAALQNPDLAELVSGDHGVAAIQHGQLPPKVLVNALLNRFLMENLFMDLFAIAAHFDNTEPGSSEGRTLHRIYAASHKVATNAARFRCITASSLLPSDRGPHNFNDIELIDAKTKTLASNTVVSALEIIGPLLNKSSSKPIKDDLLRIVQEFIRASCVTHSQYLFTRPAYQADLKHERFTMTNRRMQAHPAMQLKDDGDDGEGSTAQDAGVEGRPPDLIIEPLILRSGDGEGKTWEEERLIIPAQVWIFNPNETKKGVAAAAKPSWPPSEPNKSDTAQICGPSKPVATPEAVDRQSPTSKPQSRQNDEHPSAKTHKASRNLKASVTPKSIKMEPDTDAAHIKQEPDELSSSDPSLLRAVPHKHTITDSESATQSATDSRQLVQSAQQSRSTQQIDRAARRASNASQGSMSNHTTSERSRYAGPRHDKNGRDASTSSKPSKLKRDTNTSQQSCHHTRANPSGSNNHARSSETPPLNDPRHR